MSATTSRASASTPACSRRSASTAARSTTSTPTRCVLTPDFLPQLARIAEAFRPWGVRVALSVDFGSPQTHRRPRHLRSARSRGRRLVEGARRRALRAPSRTSAASCSRPIPKAASGPPPTAARTPTPPTWSRARSQPHGGVIFYRGFVYDHHMDWRNPKNDRARAAYDNFHPLDGTVRRQRHRPDQARPDRFPGARAGLAAVRRARENQPGDRAADHAGVLRAGAPHGLPRADVEGGARFRHAASAASARRSRRSSRARRSRGPPADSSAWRTSAWTTTGSATTSRRRTSTASAGWRGIRT